MRCQDKEGGQELSGVSGPAIEAYLRDGMKISVPEVPERLRRKCGVFVTLRKVMDGKKGLRGCIGYPYPTHVLVDALIDSAINSAVGDPRFPPVSLDEMDHVVVEVSVLTPPELVEAEDPREYPKLIKVGRDGLIVERGFYRGLLLPQVPVEFGWDEEEFLSQCCIKAGLPPDYWLVEGTKIYRFQAIVFEEKSPRGPVERVRLT